MKVIAVAALLLSIFHSSNAQIKISVSNPEPRVGQEFTIEFSGEFFDQYLLNRIPSCIKQSIKSKNFKPIERKVISTEEGMMTLGPFKIKLNGKRYKTNVITVNVGPAIEAKEGLWIKEVKIDGHDCILIEQIVKAQVENTFSTNSIGMRWHTDEENFVRLITNTSFDGVEFIEWGSGWGHNPNSLIEWPIELTYTYKYFRIKKNEDFGTPLKLSIEHFENLTKEMTLPELVIN